MLSAPRQGYRFFRCTAGDDADNPPACDWEWKEATRDIHSPSGVDCPSCGAWTFPHHSELDTTLAVDSMGNLLT